MWNKDRSLSLSIILVRILFVFIIVLCFCVPVMVHWYDTTFTERMGLLNGSVFVPLCCCLYAAAACGEVCLIHLGRLLLNLRNDKVFTAENCHHLRVISWCCLLAAIPFFVLGFWRSLSFVVAMAAGFFGLILRVLKNVFDKAVELQEDSDYTI